MNDNHKQTSGLIWVYLAFHGKDSEIAERLLTHLRTPQTDNVQIWEKGDLIGGITESELAKYWHKTVVILCLLSTDSLGDEAFVSLPASITHAKVIPILAKPCSWKNSIFSNYICWPIDEKPISTVSLEDACHDISTMFRNMISSRKEELRQIAISQFKRNENSQNLTKALKKTLPPRQKLKGRSIKQQLNESLFIRKINEKMTGNFQKKHAHTLSGLDPVSAFVYLCKLEELFANAMEVFKNATDPIRKNEVNKALTDTLFACISLDDALQGAVELNALINANSELLGTIKTSRAMLAARFGQNDPVSWANFHVSMIMKLYDQSRVVFQYLQKEKKQFE